MRRYTVSIPIAGAMHISVKANSEKDAKDAAWERFSTEGPESAFDIEWEAMDEITTGNCCHAPVNTIEVNEEPATARQAKEQ